MSFWDIITMFGSPVFWMVASVAMIGIYFLLRKTHPQKRHLLKNFLKVFLIAFIINMFLILGIKTAFPVDRPCKFDAKCLEDPSFPSGHSAAIFTVFTSFFLVCRENRYNILWVVPLLVAFSRFVIGVHTLLDVFVGSLIGIVMPVLVFLYLRKKYIKI